MSDLRNLKVEVESGLRAQGWRPDNELLSAILEELREVKALLQVMNHGPAAS